MATDDFFHARLDTMIDLRHPLAKLAQRMPWDAIEASLAPLLAHKDRAGRKVDGADLFGPTLQVAGAGVSNAGRPCLPKRQRGGSDTVLNCKPFRLEIHVKGLA